MNLSGSVNVASMVAGGIVDDARLLCDEWDGLSVGERGDRCARLSQRNKLFQRELDRIFDLSLDLMASPQTLDDLEANASAMMRLSGLIDDTVSAITAVVAMSRPCVGARVH